MDEKQGKAADASSIAEPNTVARRRGLAPAGTCCAGPFTVRERTGGISSGRHSSASEKTSVETCTITQVRWKAVVNLSVGATGALSWLPKEAKPKRQSRRPRGKEGDGEFKGQKFECWGAGRDFDRRWKPGWSC